MGTRSVEIDLNGDGTGASLVLRNVGDDADNAADRLDRLSASSDNAGRGLGMLLPAASGVAKAMGGVATSIGMTAAQLGAAVPAAAAVATTLANVAPAAGVAATGMLAMGLASVALKVGMSGVSDAVSAALDPTQAEAFNEAIKKLSPNARAFALEVKALSPELAKIKTITQDALFEGLDGALARAAKTTLPVFRDGLANAAAALNDMGFKVLETAGALGKSGTLGTAVNSATDGLKNLSMIPAQIVQGLVQIAAAAGPTFEKMTAGIAGGVTTISDKLAGAFKSGAMEDAINGAVALLKELVTVGANVGKIIGNIFAPMMSAGGGLIGVLRDITGAIAEVTASAGVQSGLKAIYDTMAVLGRTVAPLLAQALGALGPVFAALGPPAQTLIQALGAALQPIIAALGPLLTAAATAVGSLVTSFAPLLPVIGQLISTGLAVLTPFISALSTIFAAWAPVVRQVADILTTSFAPILAQLPALATPLAESMTKLGELVLPLVAEMLKELAPSFARLGEKVGELIPKLVPLIEKFAETATKMNAELIPAMLPLIEKIGELAVIFTDLAIRAIDGIVIPALEMLTALMNGDFKGAFAAAGEIVDGFVDQAVATFQAFPGKVLAALGTLAGAIATVIAAAMAGFRARIAAGIRGALADIGRMPGQVRALFASAGTWLIAAGAAIVSGLIQGVNNQVAGLFSRLASIAGSVRSIFAGALQSNSPSRVMAEVGKDAMDGFSLGVEKGWKKTKDVLGGITDEILKASRKLGDGFILGNRDGFFLGDFEVPLVSIGKKVVKALTGTVDQIDAATKKIADKIKAAFKAEDITKGQRDGMLDYLANTNDKLKDLAKEREKILDKIKQIQDYAKQLTQTVLNYAAITGIKGDDGAAPTGGQLVAGLQARLATIREFGANIKKLAAAGLSKSLLRQILDAGIDGGAAIAAELANGPSSIIAALNTAQTSIDKVAKNIGIDGADALFGSGKAMGDAFMKGLKSLEKALVDQMENLIEKLLKALGVGVDKAKGKLAELAAIQMKMGEYNATPEQEQNATPLKKAPAPAPAPPKAAPMPKYEYVPPKGGGAKSVSVNLGGVTVRDRADVNMLMNASAFAARSLQF